SACSSSVAGSSVLVDAGASPPKVMYRTSPPILNGATLRRLYSVQFRPPNDTQPSPEPPGMYSRLTSFTTVNVGIWSHASPLQSATSNAMLEKNAGKGFRLRTIAWTAAPLVIRSWTLPAPSSGNRTGP